MKNIGDKRILQFSYEFKKNPFDDEIAWGSLQLYVNNKDVCEVIRNNKIHKYEWNLTYLIEWLLDNLDYILGYDPFPFIIYFDKKLNLNDMLNLAWRKENNNDLEEILWFEALGEWSRRHSWASNDDGSCISDVYFYRKGEKFEISWYNKEKKCGKVEYVHLNDSIELKSSYVIDLILKFLDSIIFDLVNLYEGNDYIRELENKFKSWLLIHK